MNDNFNGEQSDFDKLLELACEIVTEKEAEEFLNIDVTEFTITERERERFKEILQDCNGCASR